MGTRSSRLVAIFFLLGSSFISTSTAQRKRELMIGSAAKQAEPANVKVAPDLARRVARFRSLQMPLPPGLTVKERKLAGKLVEACQYLESIYWRQMDPEALTLYQSLERSTNSRDVQLRRYLWINASRFDLIDGNKPFVGKEPMFPGRGFYPQGLTREKIEAFLPVVDHAIVEGLATVEKVAVRFYRGGAAPGPVRS